jgi:PAS domain S-box-containing protein
MPDPVVVLNDAGVIVDANQAAETVLGEPDRPILGRRWSSAVAGAIGWNDLSTGRQQRTEQPWLVDGGTRWYDVERRALRDRHGRDVGALLMLRNVTTRKQLEERLRQESYSDRSSGSSSGAATACSGWVATNSSPCCRPRLKPRPTPWPGAWPTVSSLSTNRATSS